MVEPQIVVLVVASSSLVGHPTLSVPELSLFSLLRVLVEDVLYYSANRKKDRVIIRGLKHLGALRPCLRAAVFDWSA